MSDQRTALITGGTRGIGLGIANALAHASFDLMLTGRRPEAEITAVLDELRSAREGKTRVRYRPCDIANAKARQALIKEIESSVGRLDVLVNNAGIAPKARADILEATEKSFDEVIGTNLKGTYFLTQAVANYMLHAQGSGDGQRCIINITSVSAAVASTSRGDYCISKAGLAMTTKLWAAKLTPMGIGVYEVQPGIIETDMTRGVKQKYDDLISGDLLLEKRWGTPADVGRAVAMLATGQLLYAPGSVLHVDGGMTLLRL